MSSFAYLMSSFEKIIEKSKSISNITYAGAGIASVSTNLR